MYRKFLTLGAILFAIQYPVYPTLGDGAIVVQDQAGLPTVNRNVSQSQKLTKDRRLGGLDIDATIENRAISDPGSYAEATVKNIQNVPENTVNAVNNGITGLMDLTDTAVASVTDDGKEVDGQKMPDAVNIFNLVDEYNKSIHQKAAMEQLTAQELQVLQNPQNYDLETKQVVANRYNQLYANLRGTEASSTAFFNAESIPEAQAVGSNGIDKRGLAGAHDGQTNTTYFEADRTNEQNTFARTIGHEAQRAEAAQKLGPNTGTKGANTHQDGMAYRAGSETQEALEWAAGKANIASQDSMSYGYNAQDNKMVIHGTQKIAEVGSVEAMGPSLSIRNPEFGQDTDQEIIEFSGAVGRASDFTVIQSLQARAILGEKVGAKTFDPYSHEKAAWDYGDYVKHEAVAKTARTLSEFMYQFPMYTAQDAISRMVNDKPGDYQPWSVNGPGGFRDSIGDIRNTANGAKGIPIQTGDKMYSGGEPY